MLGCEFGAWSKQGFKSIRDKLDEIATLSMDLSRIDDKLGMIGNSVDAIVAHPAFSWSEDDDDKYPV